MRVPILDLQFGVAKPGDLLPMPSPLKFGETIATLVSIEGNPGSYLHVYDLYFCGVFYAQVEARQGPTGAFWKVVE